MAVADFLFNGKPPAAVTTYGKSTTGLPQWLSDYTQGIVTKAASVANQPYQAYQGPRVASLNGDQQNAFQMTRDSAGMWEPAYEAGQNAIGSAMGLDPLGAASGYMGQASGTFNNTGTVNSYMSPYIQQVNDALAAQAGRNLNQYLLPQVNDTFTRAGQFGSAGQTRAVGNTLENLQNQLLEQQSQNLNQGFGQASSNFQADQSRLAGLGQVAGNLTAAQQQNMGNLGYNAGVLGQIGQASALKDAAALEAVGTTQQNQVQKNLDTAYSDFLDQRQYPYQQVGFLSDIARGTPYQSFASTQETKTAPYQGTMSASPLAQIASAGLGALSLSKALGFKDGGRISDAAKEAARRMVMPKDEPLPTYVPYDPNDYPATPMPKDTTSILRALTASGLLNNSPNPIANLQGAYADGGTVGAPAAANAVSNASFSASSTNGQPGPGYQSFNNWRGGASPVQPWIQPRPDVRSYLSQLQPQTYPTAPQAGGTPTAPTFPTAPNVPTPPTFPTAPQMTPFPTMQPVPQMQMPDFSKGFDPTAMRDARESWLGQLKSTLNANQQSMRDWIGQNRTNMQSWLGNTSRFMRPGNGSFAPRS